MVISPNRTFNARITYAGGDGNEVVLTVVGTAVNLSVDASSGTEAGSTEITVTATADSAVVGDQTVELGVSGGGITAGDYLLSDTVITIPNGQTTGSVTFTVTDDEVVEAVIETATLSISNPSAGLLLGTTTNRDVDIADNDSATITVQEFTLPVVESNSAQTTTQATLTFSPGATELGIPVTAQLPGNADYSSTVATFPAGSTSGLMLPIAVEGLEDDFLEMEVESFASQALTGNGGPNINYAGAPDVEVTDADIATITLTAAPDPIQLQEEGAGVDTTVELTFNQANTQLAIPIDVEFPGNTDYSSTKHTFTVGATGGTGTVTVSPIDDDVVEGGEAFTGEAITGNGGGNVAYLLHGCVAHLLDLLHGHDEKRGPIACFNVASGSSPRSTSSFNRKSCQI